MCLEQFLQIFAANFLTSSGVVAAVEPNAPSGNDLKSAIVELSRSFVICAQEASALANIASVAATSPEAASCGPTVLRLFSWFMVATIFDALLVALLAAALIFSPYFLVDAAGRIFPEA